MLHVHIYMCKRLPLHTLSAYGSPLFHPQLNHKSRFPSVSVYNTIIELDNGVGLKYPKMLQSKIFTDLQILACACAQKQMTIYQYFISHTHTHSPLFMFICLDFSGASFTNFTSLTLCTRKSFTRHRLSTWKLNLSVRGQSTKHCLASPRVCQQSDFHR